MPKMKTNSSAKKRMKVSSKGKIMRRQAMEAHLRGKMSAKRRRKLDGEPSGSRASPASPSLAHAARQR